jgi:hypothetical protein
MPRGFPARSYGLLIQSVVSPAAKALPIFEPGAYGARFASTEARRPWQDRETLSQHAAPPRGTVARRLAHGRRPFATTMKEKDNV